MRNAARIAMVLCVVASAAPAAEKWDLATDDTAIRISIAGNQPAIESLAATGTPDDWLDRPAVVPLMPKLWRDGREVAAAWVFEKGQGGRSEGSVVLRFTHAEPKLVLESVWSAKHGMGPVQHSMRICNASAARITVGHQDSLSLRGLVPRRPAEVWWIRRGGGNASTQGGTFRQPLEAATDLNLVSNCDDGASPVPWLALQVGEARGLYAGWQFSGLGRVRAWTAGRADRVNLDMGLLPEFKTDLGPGETLVVPTAFVGCYRGDLDEGSHRLHRFVLDRLRPKLPGHCPDPILAYNLYLDVGGNQAREADVLRSARFCRDLGFEAFMPDAMWFPETGDWRWDPQRFPRGVEPIEEFVHAAGMKLALWCAWTNGGVSAAPGALSVRGPAGKPEWFSGDFPPDWRPGPFYGGRICLGSSEAQRWAEEKTQWLVRRHKLDYLKHDIGPVVTDCNKTTHRHRHRVDTSYWATRAYYEVQDKLRREFPHLILENCSGGGHIKDFGVVEHTHYTVTTDTLSNLPNRQSLYDSTFALPPVVLQAYTYDNYYPVRGDNPGTFLWRTAMMGAWQIDPTDTPKWTDEEKESARRSAEVYKQWVRPMLADVKVHHVLPRPDGTRWDGMFYYSARQQRGTLYVWRPDSPEAEKVVKLKGLDPGKRYWLWCEDGAVEPGVRSGADLIAGLTLRLPTPYSSDLVFVQDEAKGKPDGLDPPGAFRLKEATVKGGMFSVSAKLSWEPSAKARSYRVRIAERPDFLKPLVETTATGAAAALDGLPPGRLLYWQVEALSWGGRRASEGRPGQLIAPPLDRPAGIAFLSDLPWTKSNAGADNPVRRDVNYHGKPLSLAGKACPKGLWTHSYNDGSPADVVYDVSGKKHACFKALAGLDDASGGGSVQFLVLVDGVKKAESPVLQPRQTHRFQVSLAGAKEVTLRVYNGGDGYACDHAVWGLARFVEAQVRDPLDPADRREGL